MYDKEDPTKFKWGGQVDWRDPAVHGVKLLLDPDQAKAIYLSNSSFKKDRKALPKEPVEVAADFIGAIYKHALTKIEAASVRDYFDICDKEFVLSVPAIWSDKAKDLTLKVCIQCTSPSRRFALAQSLTDFVYRLPRKLASTLSS